MYPFAQVSVGLPLGFQLGVRALPALEVSGSEFSTYGVGLKHNLSQYFGRRRTRDDDLEVAAIVAYDIFDVKYQWFHSLLFKMNIVLINATSIVVFFYWVTGANDFAKAPWLMFANHSWTMFTTPFEMLLSSNSKHLTMKHYYQYFVLFHFSWCFGLLLYHNPYKLPISFQEKPIGSTLLVLITSIVFSVIHYVYLKFFRNVNNVINKKKKDQ